MQRTSLRSPLTPTVRRGHPRRMTRRYVIIWSTVVGSIALAAVAGTLVVRHRASRESAPYATSTASAHPMNESFRLADLQLADALCAVRDGDSRAAHRLFEHYAMWEGRLDGLGWLIVGADQGDAGCAYDVGIAYENLGVPDLAVGYLTMAFHAAKAAHDSETETLAANELCVVAGLSVSDLALQAAPNPGVQWTRFARH